MLFVSGAHVLQYHVPMTDISPSPENATPILAFDSDHPEFMRGVEVGMHFMMLQDAELPARVVVHLSNAEMMLRIAEALGLACSSQEVDDEYMVLTYFELPYDVLDDDV